MESVLVNPVSKEIHANKVSVSQNAKTKENAKMEDANVKKVSEEKIVQ